MYETNPAPRINIRTSRRGIAQHREIVLAAQAGSPEAFAELHSIYSRRLYKKVLSITRDPQDAEDALQETFLRVYLAIHTFEGRSSIYSWMTRIAINSALIILRRRRARPEMLFDPQAHAGSESGFFEVKDFAPNPEQLYDRQQRRDNLLDAMGNLNDHLRTPLQMQIIEELPIKEIGRSLNISEFATKTRLHRARRQISMYLRRRNAHSATPSMVAAPRNSK